VTTIDQIKSRHRVVVVSIGGVAIDARALLWAEHKAIEEAFPAPRPPMVKDPTKGSGAPKIPDYHDQGYIEQDNAWFDRATVMRLAVAIGLRPAGQPAWTHRLPLAERRAWLEAAETELAENLTKADMDSLRAQYAKPTLDAALVEAGEGNSGGGQPATAG
jgi:hypothetical protein